MREIVAGKAVEEHQYVESLVRRYKDSYDIVLNEMEQMVVREELGSGGGCLHRGFYCPSPIQDLVIDNGKRGRILKRKPTKRMPEYRFRFDKDDRLVVVDENSLNFGEGYTKEFILREDGLEIGVGVQKKEGLRWIAVCRYSEGKIQSYIYGSCNFSSKYIGEMHREYYTYSEEGLAFVDWFDDEWWEEKDCLGMTIHNKYKFDHKDGYLSQYTNEDDVYYDENYLLETDISSWCLERMRELWPQYATFEEYEKAAFNHCVNGDTKVDIKLKRKI